MSRSAQGAEGELALRSRRARLRMSLLIPAHSGAGSIGKTVTALAGTLTAERIPHEIVVIDDASSDGAATIVNDVSTRNPSVRCVRSHLPPGFGHAVRAGLEHDTGDAVAIVMADSSDSPADVVRYYWVLMGGFDCAFGSRFVKGGKIIGSPVSKLVVSRVVNLAIRVMQEMGSRYAFIVLYVFLEQHLSGGDYRRPGIPSKGKLRVYAGTKMPEALFASPAPASHGDIRSVSGAQVP